MSFSAISVEPNLDALSSGTLSFTAILKGPADAPDLIVPKIFICLIPFAKP